MTTDSGASSGRFLLKQVPVGTTGKFFFQTYVVSAADEATLEAAANEDGHRYVYNGVISFLSALAGLHRYDAAWAVTKLYYSAFYLARASLCRSRHLIFHVPRDGTSGHIQYELTIAAGQRATISRVPSTHKLVAVRFQEVGYPAYMRGLTVDGLDPIQWLMEQREFWQYRSGRFPDPELPKSLLQIDASKMQRYFTTYAEDKKGIYISDPDHALVAIPFRLLMWSLAEAPLTNASIIEREEFAYLRKSCVCGKQNFSIISRQLQ